MPAGLLQHISYVVLLIVTVFEQQVMALAQYLARLPGDMPNGVKAIIAGCQRRRAGGGTTECTTTGTVQYHLFAWQLD